MATPILQRLPAVLAARGATRSKHYRDIQQGLWTRPVNVGPNFAAWPAHETEALLAARIAGATDDTVRDLVRQLHERRKTDFEKIGSRYLTQAAAGAA